MRHSGVLRAFLPKTTVFIVPATALFSMLPIVVKNELGLGATVYGILLGCEGIGTLIGVYFSPKLRVKVSNNTISVVASTLLTISIFGLSMTPPIAALSVLMFSGGLGWLLSLSSFHATTMSSVPAWVLGRAVSVYLLIFYGGMSAGAALWG